MTKKDRAEMYARFLASIGYRVYIKDNNDVIIEYDSCAYKLRMEMYDDDSFVRIVLPNFRLLHSKEERAKAKAAASLTTQAVKCAKVFTAGDEVDAVVELFLPDPTAIRSVFGRCIQALADAALVFTHNMASL